MLRKLFPLLLGLFGLVGGLAAGQAMRPLVTPPATQAGQDASEEAALTAQGAEASTGQAAGDGQNDSPIEYVKLNNQFVVPIVERGQVAALVVLAISLEVAQGQTERVYALEPKLRDAMLQVMFDHANAGGFSGIFTEGAALEPLRQALREAALRIFGPDATDVLIIDMMRQDN